MPTKEKSVFKSTISLGLMSIPVKAVMVRRSKSISFSRVCPDAHQVKYKYFCPNCEKEYQYGELKKGYKVGDTMMAFDNDFIEGVHKEMEIKGIEIIGLKKFDEIDNRGFDNQYYLIPDGVVEKPYFLFREILAQKEMCALVRYSVRNKVHLGIICPFKNVLKLTNLYYPDEIIEQPEIKEKPLTEEELELGFMFLDQISKKEIDTDKFKDDTRARLEQIIEDKLMGKEVKHEVPPKPAKKKEPDLADLLRKSIDLEKDKKE